METLASNRIQKIMLTQNGIDKINAQYNALLKRREQLRSDIHDSLDDDFDDFGSSLVENKAQLGNIEFRLNRLDKVRRQVRLLRARQAPSAGLGSRVQYAFNGIKWLVNLVDPLEADPLHGKISTESPLGKALCGSRCGQTAWVDAPKRRYDVKVLAIT